MLRPEALKTCENKISSGFGPFYWLKYKVGSRYPYLYKRDIGRLKIDSESAISALIIN